MNPKRLASDLAERLSNQPFMDYGTNWTWDEMWTFISRLKEIAGESRVKIYTKQTCYKDRVGAITCFCDRCNRHRRIEEDIGILREKLMQEHIEQYHKIDTKDLFRCVGCGGFFKILVPGTLLCPQCYQTRGVLDET